MACCRGNFRFAFHYSLFGVILLAIVLAAVLSVVFGTLHLPLKGFGKEFKTKTVKEQAVAMLGFFVFLLSVRARRRCEPRREGRCLVRRMPARAPGVQRRPRLDRSIERRERSPDLDVIGARTRLFQVPGALQALRDDAQVHPRHGLGRHGLELLLGHRRTHA